MMTPMTSNQPTKQTEEERKQAAIAKEKQRLAEEAEEANMARLDKFADEVLMPKIKELCADPASAEIELRWLGMLLDKAVKDEITRILSKMTLKDLDLFGVAPKEQADVVSRLKVIQDLMGAEGADDSAQVIKGIVGFINNSRVAKTKGLTWDDIKLEEAADNVADKPTT